jgi:uncharacterized protein YbcI
MSHSTEAPQQLIDLQMHLQTFYQNWLGHQPSHISCHLSDTTLAIIIQNSITKPEKLLLEHGQRELVQRVRHSLERLMRPQFKALIEQRTHVKVVDLLMDTHLRTSQTSIIAILSEKPQSSHEALSVQRDNASAPCHSFSEDGDG